MVPLRAQLAAMAAAEGAAAVEGWVQLQGRASVHPAAPAQEGQREHARYCVCACVRVRGVGWGWFVCVCVRMRVCVCTGGQEQVPRGCVCVYAQTSACDEALPKMRLPRCWKQQAGADLAVGGLPLGRSKTSSTRSSASAGMSTSSNMKHY